MNQEKSINSIKLFSLKFIHYVVSIALFFVFWLLFRYGEITFTDYGYRYNYYVVVAYAVILILFNRVYNAYLLGYARIRMLVFGQFLAQLFTVAIIWGGTTIAWKQFHSPLMLLLMLGIQLLIDVAWSYISTYSFFRNNPAKRTVLIYRNNLDKLRFGNIKGKAVSRIYKIVDEIQYDGTFTELREQLAGYEAVFVAGVNSRCRNGILKYCKEEGIPGFFLPHVGDVIMQDAKHIQTFDAPVLYVNRRGLKVEYAFIKRKTLM